jgi:diguanylate cyclase (GGDEF)-like protein
VKNFKVVECWALRSRRTFIAGSEEVYLRCDHVHEDDFPISSPFTYLCDPINVDGELAGVFHHLIKTSQFDPNLEFLVTAISEHTVNALSNLLQREKLHALSIRDSLTGLFNRRYMQEALRRELSRSARYQQPLSILMIDIDHFKDFNDKYGHAAGDSLLKALGEFMHNNLRAEDIACRYGGEEFLIILPNTDLPAGILVAHKIWQGVRHMWIEHEGQPRGPVTLSVGVASCPKHSRNPQVLIHVADQAMYRAKHLGRDRVIFAGQHDTISQDEEDSVFSSLMLKEGSSGN